MRKVIKKVKSIRFFSYLNIFTGKRSMLLHSFHLDLQIICTIDIIVFQIVK